MYVSPARKFDLAVDEFLNSVDKTQRRSAIVREIIHWKNYLSVVSDTDGHNFLKTHICLLIDMFDDFSMNKGKKQYLIGHLLFIEPEEYI